MRCHLIMSIWFNLFQIDSGILTIRNSYALQWRSLRIAVKDKHRALTDELVCKSPLNGRVDHCESQCLALFSLGRCHMDLPGPTTSMGTTTDYSVGPWDYSVCVTQHLMAWGARTTVEKYSIRKLYMSCTM
jgi:hypothetical protein